MKAAIWVQHLIGTGHAVRAAALARALNAEGVAATILTGAPLPDAADADGLDVIHLPFCRVADYRFRPVLNDAGEPVDEAWWENRRAATRAALDTLQPDIIVTEHFPFGRRPFRRELFPILAEQRARPRPPVIAASLRDILVQKPNPQKLEWMIAAAAESYDLVLVHGDPAFSRLEDTVPAATRITDHIRYTGYVYEADRLARPPADDAGWDEIIVSNGGGAWGGPLMEALPEAISRSAAGRSKIWRVLLGPDTPHDAADRLRALIASNVRVEDARSDFPALLTRAALSVSLGGYNTTLDILASGVRAVIVPQGAVRQTEQRQRAAALAAAGRVVALDEAHLTGAALADAIDTALAAPAAKAAPEMNGATTAARMLIEAAERRL